MVEKFHLLAWLPVLLFLSGCIESSGWNMAGTTPAKYAHDHAECTAFGADASFAGLESLVAPGRTLITTDDADLLYARATSEAEITAGCMQRRGYEWTRNR